MLRVGRRVNQALSTVFFTASLTLPIACWASPFFSWIFAFGLKLGVVSGFADTLFDIANGFVR